MTFRLKQSIKIQNIIEKSLNKRYRLNIYVQIDDNARLFCAEIHVTRDLPIRAIVPSKYAIIL